MIEATMALLVVALMIVSFQRWSLRALHLQHRLHQVHLLAITLPGLPSEQYTNLPSRSFPPAWPAPVSEGPPVWLWIRGNDQLMVRSDLWHFQLTYCGESAPCVSSSQQYFAF